MSHDLLEGSYARAALVSDVQLFEEFPSRYSADTRRRHRWMRGDWQIAAWLLPRLPGLDMRRVENPLTGLSRWKFLTTCAAASFRSRWFFCCCSAGCFSEKFRRVGNFNLVHHRAAVAAGGRHGIFAQAERFAVLFAFAKCRRNLRAPVGTGDFDRRVSALRRGYQPRRRFAHALAIIFFAPAFARMANVQRF